MQHVYTSKTGETLELTSAFVLAAEQEGKIIRNELLSTEHVTHWEKVEA